MSLDNPGVRLDGVRVLLVDDDEDMRYLARVTLQSEGAIVTESETARHAFNILQVERPDVLITDLSMSGEDGFWLIRAVRGLSIAHGGGTPAAALSGHVTANDRAEVLRAGFQFHVPKPVPLTRLVGIVAILALKE
jgi:two-component system, chemotaxis family, CheB/CheR fusion protein